MSNNYQQSSFSFDIRSPDELSFLRVLEERAERAEERDEEAGGDVPPFEVSIIEFGWGWTSEHEATSAAFYAEESCNVEAMVLGLQEFLAKFRGPTETISLTWANTCDRPLGDSFSGGGVAFTATRAKWIDAETAVRTFETQLQTGDD